MTNHRAVFIDKDGTLIRDVPYNVDPALIELQPFAGESLKAMKDSGYQLIVVSNQSGVAKGYFPESALQGVQSRIRHLLDDYKVSLDGFYYCPHHPAGILQEYGITCACRKPQPGMILEASRDYGIDLRRSWMIGDILDDIEAGNAAGCTTILLDNGNETEFKWSEQRKPAFTVSNLREAADIIVNKEIHGTAALASH